MFKFFKNLSSKKNNANPIDHLLELNEDGLRSFIEGDIEHFKKLDKTTYNLIVKLKRDFVQPIAEITPEGKLLRIKPGVTEEQIVFVTKHIQKMISKILELRSVNNQLIQDFLKSNKCEQEHRKMYTEIDKILDNPSVLDDRIDKYFQSILGKEFSEEYTKKINSKSFRRWMESSSQEDFRAYIEENHSFLTEIHKKYDLGPVGYDIPEEE